jgi:hypothetical protein
MQHGPPCASPPIPNHPLVTHTRTPHCRRDWLGKYAGRSTVALQPRTTAQASALLAHCGARRLAVVPQGGNTGLVGGSVPVHDEVVLSTSAMGRVLSFDEVRACRGLCVCGVGWGGGARFTCCPGPRAVD